MGMVNRVVLRVRDDRGAGLAGVPVRVKHKTCVVGGKIERMTDRMGLVGFEIKAKQPSIRLKIEVQLPGQPWVKAEEPMLPRGRRMLLRTKTPVFRPGDPIEATLMTWEAEAEKHCDLLQEGAVLWSGEVKSAKHEAKLSIDVACAGICHLQCAGHPWDPGDEFATVPIVVTAESTLTALTALVAAENILHPKSLEVPPGVNTERAARYFLTFLQQEPFSPALWLSTRDNDLAIRSAQVKGGKQQVLWAIVGVFILIVCVVADILMRNISAQRRRMREFAEETLGDIEAQSQASPADMALQTMLALDVAGTQSELEHTRGMLLVFAMAGALLANLVGIIWLLALVGEA
jgi:hypothetical protein